MRDSGRTTCRKAKEGRSGQTGLPTLGSTERGRRKAMESTYGLMDRSMKAGGCRTGSTGSESTSGLTAGDTKESGETTTCMEKEFILGRMEGSTKGITKMTRRTGMACILGQMVDSIEVNGSTENRTEKASIHLWMERLEGGNGLMANESNGLMIKRIHRRQPKFEANFRFNHILIIIACNE